MSAPVSLRLRAALDGRVDLEGVTPDGCAALSEREIARLPVTIAGRPAAIGDLFDVRGGGSTELRFEGDLARVDRIGAGMTGGELVVDGDAGDDAGLAMAGGLLRIRGNAGHRLGSALPGASKGMSGGEIIVGGSVGDDAAARARRGLVVVGGTTGAAAGRAMIAGTLVAFGRIGEAPGLGNKRGSVLAMGGIDVPASYRYACTYEPPFVRLLLTYLERRYGLVIGAALRDGRYRRYCGDAAGPGKGEILAFAD